MNLRRLIIPAVTIAVAATAAQARKVSGTSVYYVPETQSLYEARQTAAERARIEAIEKAFGSLVSMVNTTETTEYGRVNFRSTGRSEVRGIWLRDTSPLKQTVMWDEKLQSLVLETTVHGDVEELKAGKADVQCTVLRNGTDPRMASTEFRDGDNLYLRLRSSDNGYVAVYLMDDEGRVHTALPYRRDGRGCVAVERGRDYLFFDPTTEGVTADAYRLRTTRSNELCRLCVLFSPDPFSASAAEDAESSDRARSQSFDDFDRRLMQLRDDIPEIQTSFINIIIRK